MKKKLLFCSILLIILMFFISCDKKDENVDEEFNLNVSYKTNYEIYVDDFFNPFYDSYRVGYNFESTNENVASVSTDGTIRGISSGDAKIYLKEENVKIGCIKIKVLKSNSINYNCTKEKIDKLDSLFNQYSISKSVVEDIKMTVDDKTKNFVEKITYDPFYIEIQYEDNIEILNIDKDKLYLIDVDKNLKNIKTSCLGSLESANFEKEDYYYAYESITSIDYNELELNELDNNKFEIKFSFNNLNKYFLENDLNEISSYFDTIKNTIVTETITFGKNNIDVNIHFVISYNEDNVFFNMPFDFEMKLKFEDFVQFDFDPNEYNIAPSLKIDDVLFVSKKFEFDINPSDKGYLAYDLKNGRYLFEASQYKNALSIKMYDENFNLIKDFKSFEYDYTYNNSFDIEKDGVYYFYIFWDISGKDTININKLNYKTETSNLEEHNEGIIDGKADYHLYKYESKSETELLKIKNKLNTPLYIFVKDGTTTGAYGHTMIEGLKETYINPTEDTKIYIISKEYFEYEAIDPFSYEYSFDVETIDIPNGNNYEALDEVGLEYDDEFLIGFNYKPIRFKLNVPKYGIISFYRKNLKNEENELSVKLIDDIGSSYNSAFNLFEGEYVFEVEGNNHVLDIYQIKYKFDELNLDIDIDLPIYDGNYPYIESVQVSQYQEVKYHFDLAEDSYIFYGSDDVTIYENETNKKVSIVFDTDDICIKLAKGSYYAISNLEKLKFVLGIVNHPASYIDLNTNNYLDLDKEITIATNEENLNRSYKIKLDKSNDILINKNNNLKVYIYDENLNKVNESYLFNCSTCHLEANKTYYIIAKKIIYAYQDSSVASFSISAYE